MNLKKILLSIVISAGMGGLFGYVFSYVGAVNQELPETMVQYSHSLGMAGLTAGIISGVMSIIIPYILLPLIRKIETVQKVINSYRLFSKIEKSFGNNEEDLSS